MALLVATACAGGNAQLQQDVSSLQAQVRTLQKENTDLARQVEALTNRVEVLSTRSRPAEPAPASARSAQGASDPVVIPPNLKVVKLKPAATTSASPAAAAPEIPTSTPIREPDSAGKRTREGAPAVQGAAP